MKTIDVASKLIKIHEGLRLKPYRCTAGKLTIGWGRNLEDRGITEHEADIMLINDVDEIADFLPSVFPVWDELGTARKACLIDLCYNLGNKGFLSFKKMIKWINRLDFDNAAAEMVKSKWYGQVGGRSRELVRIMRTGQLV